MQGPSYLCTGKIRLTDQGDRWCPCDSKKRSKICPCDSLILELQKVELLTCNKFHFPRNTFIDWQLRWNFTTGGFRRGLHLHGSHFMEVTSWKAIHGSHIVNDASRRFRQLEETVARLHWGTSKLIADERRQRCCRMSATLLSKVGNATDERQQRYCRTSATNEKGAFNKRAGAWCWTSPKQRWQRLLCIYARSDL